MPKSFVRAGGRSRRSPRARREVADYFTDRSRQRLDQGMGGGGFRPLPDAADPFHVGGCWVIHDRARRTAHRFLDLPPDVLDAFSEGHADPSLCDQTLGYDGGPIPACTMPMLSGQGSAMPS